jgi:hypothetical protein
MIGLTIRMGAAHYDITTPDGAVFDLASMTKAERNKARRLTVGIFQQNQKGNA